jgi:predicted GNAT superfamily acetyltransferase
MLSISQNGSIEEVQELIRSIPEFNPVHQREDFEKRFKGNYHLILIAYWNSEKAGFKVGYNRYQDGSFYSWLGAVIPKFRRRRIAGSLAEAQEKWAQTNGYISIKVKTRNKFSAMLQFLINSGFRVVDIEKKADPGENRILFEKLL